MPNLPQPAVAQPAAPVARPVAAPPAAAVPAGPPPKRRQEEKREFSLIEQRGKVFVPGILLMIYGGLTAGLYVLLLMAALADRIPPDELERLGPYGKLLLQPTSQIALFGVVIAAYAIVFFGGWKMIELDGLLWPTLAAIIGMFPCTGPCCLIGLPIGIWSLMMILDPDVWFAMRTRGKKKR